ncbi:MAG TPA: hypothetical protein VMN78_06205, partial [Longimicrobiales bacterium]|nr:hypothetical protein [Longimicrobiales bacterium]
MRGLRLLFMEGPIGLAKQLEPELAACAQQTMWLETVTSVPALEASLRRARWDAVVVATEAPVGAEEVSRA